MYRFFPEWMKFLVLKVAKFNNNLLSLIHI